MNTHETNTTACHCDTEARSSSLTRRVRLASRLMRAEMRRALRAEAIPTRGDVTAAMRAIEDRAAEALSAEELTAALAALDKIIDALGGPDALPYRAHGPRGFGPHRRGHSRAHRRF